jgi:GT2 family glycosyltransferase
MKDQDPNQLRNVDWILGAAMGIRRAAFEREQLFDTRYRLYFEDVDLCYFAKKAGWQIIYCPTAKMIHDHQRASAKNLFSSVTINHFLSWIKFYLKSTST